MVRATRCRSHTHTGWWLAVAVLLALAVLLAWTAWQNEALRARVAALEQENRALAQALAARAGAAPQPGPPATVAVESTRLPPAGAPAAADPLAASAKPPASTPHRQGPLEEALQRLREPVPNPDASPFGRP